MIKGKQFAISLAVASSVMLIGCQNAAPPTAAAVAVPPAQTQPVSPAVVVVPPPVPVAPVAVAVPAKNVNAVSPELLDALRQLTADDFKARQEAVTKLQEMMARQVQEMLLVQNIMLQIQDSLAEQLHQMTQTQDPEGQARVAGLFEFNYALSRFAIDAIALPREESDRLLKWGLQKENLPLVARAYNRSDETRSAAAHQLAKITSPETDWILLQLLNDNSREVSLNTLDAIYDRKPSNGITTALWDRATIALNQYRNRPNRMRNLNIHGRMLTIYEDPNYNNRMQDTDFAVDVIIKQKDPKITELLNNLFIEMTGTINNNNDYRWRSLSPSYGGDSGRAIARLVEAFKPKQAVIFYVKALSSNANDGNDQTMNNEKIRYSSRIDFAAMLVQAIGQDPDDYGMKKYQNWGDRWLIKGGQPEEEAMIKKLQTWWKEHAADYGEKAPATPTTQPETPIKGKRAAADVTIEERKARAVEAVEAAKAEAETKAKVMAEEAARKQAIQKENAR